MDKDNDHQLWITAQIALVETLLADYQGGHRKACYTLADGSHVDETAQVIGQPQSDIARLRSSGSVR
ncbi:MAG: hypothetical protein KDK12_13640 [Rhodobacteraceae bacterium]|nr:hypothetical protein [Paracoccaceae bacterium]